MRAREGAAGRSRPQPGPRLIKLLSSSSSSRVTDYIPVFQHFIERQRREVEVGCVAREFKVWRWNMQTPCSRLRVKGGQDVAPPHLRSTTCDRRGDCAFSQAIHCRSEGPGALVMFGLAEGSVCCARSVGPPRRESAAAAATSAIAATAPRITSRNRCPAGRRTGMAPGATSSADK